MHVNLYKIDLIKLVKSTPPHFDIMDLYPFSKLGYYNGSSGDYSWDDDFLNTLSELSLFKIYEHCKQSWIINK